MQMYTNRMTKKAPDTLISYKNEHGKITLEIVPEGNGYEGMPRRRAYRIDLMNMEKPMRLIDGEGEITFGEGKITVTIPEKDAKNRFVWFWNEIYKILVEGCCFRKRHC